MTMFRISTRQVVLVCVTIVLTTLSAGSLFISASSAQELVLLELSPRTATNPVGTQHCVTATVRGLGGPVSGAPVHFTVGGTAIEAVKTTVANGNAMFCYTGPAAPRTDTITAILDTGQRPLPAQPAVALEHRRSAAHSHEDDRFAPANRHGEELEHVSDLLAHKLGEQRAGWMRQRLDRGVRHDDDRRAACCYRSDLR
jgi:hypothetical protein